MSEDAGRRSIRNAGRSTRLRSRAARIGEPNVLSNAATPNTLSGMLERPANVTTGARKTARGQPASWLATGETATRRRVGVPSFGTLIFLGFLVFTGLRLIGEFVRDLEAGPAATSPAGGQQATAPGSIIFGFGPDGDCGIVGASHEFSEGAEVWWSALLGSEQAADAEVIVIVRRDGAEVDRETVPPDPDFGTWSVLCAGSPVRETLAGLYLVEVWDVTVTTRHAIGQYRLVPA